MHTLEHRQARIQGPPNRKDRRMVREGLRVCLCPQIFPMTAFGDAPTLSPH